MRIICRRFWTVDSIRRQRRNSRVRGALYILIATLIAGSIAYQISGGGAVTTEAAQAALSAAGVVR